MSRKVDAVRNGKILDVFQSASNRQEFLKAVKSLGLAESTGTVYWYDLCRKHDRRITEKRGRKSTKMDATEKTIRLFKVVEFVKAELAKAKAAKKSTATLNEILKIATEV